MTTKTSVSAEMKNELRPPAAASAVGAPPAVPPQGKVMQLMMGAWMSQTVSTMTRLNIPDFIHKHGPLSAKELVERHGVKVDAEFLRRALRACASIGIFTESSDGRFGPTPMSETLTIDSPVSVKKMAEMFGASWWKVWTGLPDALRSGRPQSKAQLGMEYWDYCQANPKEMEDFGQAMKSNSLASMRGVLEHCEFAAVKSVVDVGGGFGHLAIALLKKYPALRATVIDLPTLVPIAQKHAAAEDASVTSRLTFAGGDMFADVPPGESYVLKHIIHDWDDARCMTLLRHCRNRMVGDGRVYCVDAVLPPMGDTSGASAKFLDMNMLVIIPGKERTEAEWRELFAAAGLRLVTINPLHDNFGTSILEAKKAKVAERG